MYFSQNNSKGFVVFFFPLFGVNVKLLFLHYTNILTVETSESKNRKFLWVSFQKCMHMCRRYTTLLLFINITCKYIHDINYKYSLCGMYLYIKMYYQNHNDIDI